MERQQLEQAIAQLEKQRAILGDAVVTVSIAAIQQQLADIAKELTSDGAGERKLVTVMFADISGFTTLAEKMDPEALRDLMNRCFDRLVPCIQNYDGTIDKFIGDEIMALFGAPTTHENDPERALRAALDMQTALAKFNAEHNTQLGIHFGINTGLVLAGGIGSSGKRDYSVMGDAVNLASRLEDISDRGQALVGADTYRLTAPLFNFEALAPVSVKGKSETVAVYRLTGAKAGMLSTRGLERRGLRSPLVGREKEFEAVKSCLEALRWGQGGIIGVIGEAGLGKSRLMAEMRHCAADVRWLEGKTISFGQTSSYWPFQEIMRSYAGITEDDTELEAWHKLEGKILALFPNTAIEILPYLATLLAIEVQGGYIERVKYLDSDALGKRVILAARRFIEYLARIQPLVLVFEDLHWMDVSSAELLELILPLVREVPLLVVGISRPDPGTAGMRLQAVFSGDYTENYLEIRLAPLSPNESHQLVNNLLTVEGLPADVRETIASKADGNPFFLEEIIRSLLDLGAIVRDPASGNWRATAQIEAVHIPDTVQGVIMARIDRLDEGVKQALRVASVIGRSFLYRVLREIEKMDSELDNHLMQLQQLELIRKKELAPELEYIFNHALAQEATYESILIQKRRDLHGRVAAAIETLCADRLDEFYSLLAYHYARAENWAKAQEYLFKSGDQAGRMAADAETLAHYQKAAEACRRAFGSQWAPFQQAQLEKKMADVLYRRGEYRQAETYSHKALANLGSPFPRSKWTMRGAILQELGRQIANRLRPHPVAKRAEPDPRIELEFAIYQSYTLSLLTSDLEKALLCILRMLNRAETIGDKDLIAISMSGIVYPCLKMNLHWLAEYYLKLASKMGEDTTDPVTRGFLHINLGFYLYNLGQIEEAKKNLRISMSSYRDIGNQRELVAEIYYANLLFHQGDFRAALDIWQQQLALSREMQNVNIECMALQGVVKNSLILGECSNAIDLLKLSIDLAQKANNYLDYVASLSYLGRYYSHTGQIDEGLACFEEALAGIEKYKTYGNANMQAYNGYAEACLQTAEQNPAERGRYLQKASLYLSKGQKQGQSARCNLPETLRLHGTYSWLKGKPSEARAWWERSLQMAKDMGERYSMGLAYLEMGQRLNNSAHLQRAAELFGNLGATPDQERTKDLLVRMPVDS